VSTPAAQEDVWFQEDVWLQVKAVVIDSVAFVFRFHSAPASKRACMIHTMMSSLRRLAALGVAVIIINQVTGYTGSSSDDFAPALGALTVCSMLPH
jgi:RecA/RadA recombinase